MEQTSQTSELAVEGAVREALPRVGPRIAGLRDARGWKQVVLARRAGIRPARLSRIEKGKETPGLAEFLRLAAALDVRLEELAFGEGREAGGSEVADLVLDIEAFSSPEEIALLGKLLHALGVVFLRLAGGCAQGRRP